MSEGGGGGESEKTSLSEGGGGESEKTSLSEGGGGGE